MAKTRDQLLQELLEELHRMESLPQSDPPVEAQRRERRAYSIVATKLSAALDAPTEDNPKGMVTMYYGVGYLGVTVGVPGPGGVTTLHSFGEASPTAEDVGSRDSAVIVALLEHALRQARTIQHTHPQPILPYGGQLPYGTPVPAPGF